MKRVIVQAVKEWNEFKRDRLSLALAFLLPLATMLFFGFGVRLQPKHVPVVVRDLDKSSVSRRVVDRLDTTDVLAKGRAMGSDAATLSDGGARGIFIFPDGFGDDVEFGDPAKFTALVDGSDINTAQTVKAVARQIGISASQEIDDAKPDAVKPDVQILFNPDLKESLFIVPGVFGIVLFMYPALLAAVAAAREIEQGTIVQVYSSSLSALEVLLGKALVYVAVGAAEAAVVAAGAWLIFGLKFACEPSSFIVTTAVYLFAAVFFGLLVGTFAGSPTVAVQATATGGFFPSLLLSGFVYPIANIPYPLSTLCSFVPARYYIDACRNAFLRGSGWSSSWTDPIVLALFALVFLFGAWCLMRPMQLRSRHA